MRRAGWLGAGVAAVVAGGAACAQQVAPAPRAAALPATQALFDGYVRAGKMPGIVGMFGTGDAPSTVVAAGRIADDPHAPAADADTLWRVYSMTKPVTAAAAMILVGEGKIGLDQPVADFIPGFRSMRVLTDPAHSLATRPAARPVTVRNLLTHTAGLGYNVVTTGPLLAEYEKQGILPEAINTGVEAQMRRARPASLKEFADRVATLPLIADPGTTWSYSIGLDVMARVVEVAAGMPFERFVQTRIFDPLGMRSSYWTVPKGQAGRLATNYLIVGNALTPIDPGGTSVFLQPPSFPYGGAGLVMSARDYDRFLHMLQNDGELDGVRIMKPETVALMTSDLLPAGVRFSGSVGANGTGSARGVPMGFGAGGAVTLADMPGGPAKGTYGWDGAAGTFAWVDRTRRARGVVMVNYFPPNAWPVRAETYRSLAADRGYRP